MPGAAGVAGEEQMVQNEAIVPNQVQYPPTSPKHPPHTLLFTANKPPITRLTTPSSGPASSTRTDQTTGDGSGTDHSTAVDHATAAGTTTAVSFSFTGGTEPAKEREGEETQEHENTGNNPIIAIPTVPRNTAP